MKVSNRATLSLLAVLALLAASCGGSDDSEGAAADQPTVVVTTNILGDVVEQMVGDHVNVVTIMPVGADPHDFQPSAQQVASMGDGAVLIVNGAAFEEGLLDVIESTEADGTPVYEAISAVSTIEFASGGGHDDHGHDDHDDHGDEDKDHDDHGHDDHGDEDHDDEDHDDEDHDDEHGDEDHADEDHDDEHGDEDHADEDHDDEHADEDHDDEDHDDEDHADEHGDEDHDEDHGDEDHDHEEKDDDHDDHGDDDHGHAHDGDDPHFFTDPASMADAAEGIADFLIASLEGVDAEAMRESADEYIAELRALDSEIAESLSALSADQRVLVTNHAVFGYFAERYDFEVVGAVIPSVSTAESADAQALAELAELIQAEGVGAIFSDTSTSDELAQTLAAEAGDVQVIALFTESLGDADSSGATYIEMIRTNVERIVDGLGS